MNHLKQTVHVHVKVRSMPQGKRKTKPESLKLEKIEDPIDRLARQQRRSEQDVSAATKGMYAKQRDSHDPTFGHQGPQTYGGGNFGYGTRDRMPGTTPYRVKMNPLEAVLDALGIEKFIPMPEPLIKPKNTGDYI